jgi:GT2 family glycosyltransferase
MRAVDLSIVTYRPDLPQLQQLIESLAEPARTPIARRLLILDNSEDAATVDGIRALPPLSGGAFERVDVQRSPANVGFGRGHNASAARGDAPFVFVLNQDCVLEPGALERVIDIAYGDAAEVAAWELRQIPYEHPKSYDPSSLDTIWVSGAATLFRRRAFDEVGGFEPRIFMYGEDVDLSWRLRARGWRLTYQPRAACVHRTYREAAEVKPLQVFGGVTTNLCLRARYGGNLATLRGLAMLGGEIMAPASFPGRRSGLVRAGARFLRQWPYFVRTRVRPTASFHPVFSGWSYELRRDGAFIAMRSAREGANEERPLVSILIRTVNRPHWLREALASCANQTYGPIEVIVVEDGPERSREVVDAFRGQLDVRYLATGEHVGRARAGNIALETAAGAWLNFLDDDDALFADHVEVLVEAAMAANAAGAYGLAWETHTEVERESGHYREHLHVTRHHQAFDRLTLWHHNYLPIQAVLFHRRLYERHGGFAEDMDQLEDWNLWTRYTLEDDFVLVPKTTSKYRVPVDARIAAGRQALLDHAYADALERQRHMRVSFSPREFSEMAEAYARRQTLLMVTRSDVRRFVGRSRVMSRLAAYRPVARRVLRRMGWRR